MGNLSHWMKPGFSGKSAARILTVDQSTRSISAALTDGGGIKITVWSVPVAFRWPKSGEVWYVRKDNGYWILDSRVVSDLEDSKAVGEYADGDLRLDSEVVRDSRGNRFITIQGTPLDGDVATWDAALGAWIPQPGGGGTPVPLGPSFIFNQPTPTSTWVINHGLNTYPSVTLVDSGGVVFKATTTYNNQNTITVSMLSSQAGKAYLYA